MELVIVLNISEQMSVIKVARSFGLHLYSCSAIQLRGFQKLYKIPPSNKFKHFNSCFN
jgi:hypothetical protein